MNEHPSNREKTSADGTMRLETAVPSGGQRAGIAAELLALLRCPKSRQTLALAEPEVLARLEAARVMGRLRDLSGRAVAGPLEGGLVRADGALFYPIRDGIPVLLAEEAVALPLASEER
jgi:uncharacterized protein YbaR (Trm112 family)